MYLDAHYSHNYSTPSSRTPKSGTSDVCSIDRDEPTSEDDGIHKRILSTHGSWRQGSSLSGKVFSAEKIQSRMKLLEDSNIVMQKRNQNLIAENKVLTNQLNKEAIKVKILEKKVLVLQEDLAQEKIKYGQKILEKEKTCTTLVEDSGTSTTSIIQRSDRGIQVWAFCKGCQRKLESCEKEPPTVTITKSELETLERDMQTLKDAIIVREEAWDKAMEREQNYREQLMRLTTEMITVRHLCETRSEELQSITNLLTEKEMELKLMQKEKTNLSKLIAKLYNQHCRKAAEATNHPAYFDISEKDKKIIEDIIHRTSCAKNKQKAKPRSSYADKSSLTTNRYHSPRDKI